MGANKCETSSLVVVVRERLISTRTGLVRKRQTVGASVTVCFLSPATESKSKCNRRRPSVCMCFRPALSALCLNGQNGPIKDVNDI